MTPLHCVAAYYHQYVVQMVIYIGADPDKANKTGTSPTTVGCNEG